MRDALFSNDVDTITWKINSITPVRIGRLRADLHGTIFVAYDKLTTGLRHDLRSFRVNRPTNELPIRLQSKLPLLLQNNFKAEGIMRVKEAIGTFAWRVQATC